MKATSKSSGVNVDLPPSTVTQHAQNDRELFRKLAQLRRNSILTTLPVVALLTEFIALGFGVFHVLDTHGQWYLNNLTPELTIQRYTYTVDKFNVAAVIDHLLESWHVK